MEIDLKPYADYWSLPGRPTRIFVDLDAIQTNASNVVSRLSPNTRLMAVVKANGYGHGGSMAARAAVAGGASYLGVATIDEALELRSDGIQVPILVLGPVDTLQLVSAIEHSIEITIGSPEQFREALSRSPGSEGRPLRVHLKVETGMNRFGLTPAQVLQEITTIGSCRNVVVVGLFTHFADADGPTLDSTYEQTKIFRNLIVALQRNRLYTPLFHCANSAALLRSREFDFAMVRAGICLYGAAPSGHVPLFEQTRSALTWQGRICRVLEIERGERVGYGGTYIAESTERIGLVPVGYADGYPRSLSNRSWVGWKGLRLPVRGRVSMDQIVVGLSDQANVCVGDIVTLLGPGDPSAPTAEELADLAGTVPYEILARISPRVPVHHVRTRPIVEQSDRVNGGRVPVEAAGANKVSGAGRRRFP